jgi:hypothetical protein
MTRFNQAAREHGATSKLCWQHGGDVAAFAGDECSYFVARDIYDAFKDGSLDFSDEAATQRQLSEIAERCWQRQAQALGDRWIPGLDRTALTIMRGALWRIDIANMSGVYRIRDCTVARDSSNTARFFSVLYSDVRKPVDELVFLAAHVINIGHRLNPLLISGLEIALYSSGSLSFLEPSPIERLVSRSNELEETTRKAIYG